MSEYKITTLGRLCIELSEAYRKDQDLYMEEISNISEGFFGSNVGAWLKKIADQIDEKEMK